MLFNDKTEEWVVKSIELGFDEKSTWDALQSAGLTEGTAFEDFSRWYLELRESAKRKLQSCICNAIFDLDDAIKNAKKSRLVSNAQIDLLLSHNNLKQVE